MKIKCGELFDKFGTLVPAEVMAKETQAFLNGEDYIEVDDNIYDIIEDKRKERELFDCEMQLISDLRITAIQTEKDGDIIKAIELYTKCIDTGEASSNKLFHAYAHAYERIIILLHKTKQYIEEAEYIKRYLSHDELSTSVRQKFSTRLSKLEK